MTVLDQVRHLLEEEGDQERCDMGAVHIGIRHDDDLVVSEALHVEVVSDPRSDGRDHHHGR